MSVCCVCVLCAVCVGALLCLCLCAVLCAVSVCCVCVLCAVSARCCVSDCVLCLCAVLCAVSVCCVCVLCLSARCCVETGARFRCPLAELTRILAPVTPNDWARECGVTSRSLIERIEEEAGGYAVAFALLLTAVCLVGIALAARYVVNVNPLEIPV